MYSLSKKVSWTSIPDVVIKSKNLSFPAKAVYCYLSTLKEGEALSTEKIVESCKEGTTAIKSAIKELLQEGFLTKKEKGIENEKPVYEYVLGTGYELLPENKPAPILEKVDSKELAASMEQCFNLWNTFCVENKDMPKIMGLTPKRKDKLRTRMLNNKDFVLMFPEILKAIKEQPFCLGSNDRQWKVSFDFVIDSDDNYVKILERRYTGGVKRTSATAMKQAGDKIREEMKQAGIDF